MNHSFQLFHTDYNQNEIRFNRLISYLLQVISFYLLINFFIVYYDYFYCYEEHGCTIDQCPPDDLEEITYYMKSIATNALPLLCGNKE